MAAAIEAMGGGRAMSAVAERRVFSRLRMPGGIFKTTSARRLTDVDAATVDALPAPGSTLAAIDVGASSGTTAVELVTALATAGHRVRMTMTDISLTARQLRVHPGYTVLVDAETRLLQHIVLGVPIRPWRRRLDYVTQFWLATGAANRWHARMAANGAIDRALQGATLVLLVAPAAAEHPDIACEEGDVFAPPPANHRAAFDIVRAANLLLPEVFSTERIVTALEHLKARLRGPGSLLVLARSPAPGRPGSNRATIYRLNAEDRLEVAARIGGGCDIEALAGT
ncbi:hypothetical protein [Glacieibacterium sp.]|uniref:hypothetical protein n=1 Tax=Glacieibacterium sp. TaxID=2860237 RepID=UPI003AFF62A2